MEQTFAGLFLFLWAKETLRTLSGGKSAGPSRDQWANQLWYSFGPRLGTIAPQEP